MASGQTTKRTSSGAGSASKTAADKKQTAAKKKTANTFLEEFESDKATELLDKLIHEKSWLCWGKNLEAAKEAVTMEYDDDKAMDILKKLLGGK